MLQYAYGGTQTMIYIDKYFGAYALRSISINDILGFQDMSRLHMKLFAHHKTVYFLLSR